LPPPGGIPLPSVYDRTGPGVTNARGQKKQGCPINHRKHSRIAPRARSSLRPGEPIRRLHETPLIYALPFHLGRRFCSLARARESPCSPTRIARCKCVRTKQPLHRAATGLLHRQEVEAIVTGKADELAKLWPAKPCAHPAGPTSRDWQGRDLCGRHARRSKTLPGGTRCAGTRKSRGDLAVPQTRRKHDRVRLKD